MLADSHGDIPSQLRPLARVIAEAPSGDALLSRLQPGSAAVTVAQLIRDTGRPLTHDLLDELPTDASTHWLRHALVSADVLPRRDEYLERIGVWLAAELAEHTPSTSNLLLGYAHWSLLRRARSRAARVPATTPSAAEALRAQLRAALALARWIDDKGAQLETIDQEALDRWICAQSSTIAGNAQGFVTWLRLRGINGGIVIPTRQSRASLPPLTEVERCTLLDRCVHDRSLPIDVRAAGALILVYGFPLTRIGQLSRQDLTTDEHDRTRLRMPPYPPIQLPPLIAELLYQQAAAAASDAKPSGDCGPRDTWLFPGSMAGRPTVVGLARRVRHHLGLNIRQARSAALLNLAMQLPPAVLAPVTGLHVRTATTWTDLVAQDWSSYLEARANSGELVSSNR